MITKTQRVVSNMNYLLDLKTSGGTDNIISSEIFKDLSDIFGNQVKNGFKTEDEIEDFANMLPTTEEMFNNPSLHNNLAVLRPRFNESISVITAEKNVENARVA